MKTNQNPAIQDLAEKHAKEWPSLQDQIDYWNKKEGEELERVSRIQEESLVKRDESRDATNETRRAYIEGDGTKMQIYVRSMGKLLAVTALFNSDDNANSYCEKHRDEGVVATAGNLVFLANLHDHGTRAELPMSIDRTKVYLTLPQIPDDNAATTAKTLDGILGKMHEDAELTDALHNISQEEERREDCARWFDDKEQAYNDSWSLRDAGSNDGEGESYASRNA